MGEITETTVLAALSRIEDSERGGDVVTLGMIAGVEVREGHVQFSVEVAPERGPKAEPLRKACEEAVKALDGVLSVTAVLTAERASPPRAAAAAAPQPQQPAALPGIKSMLAIASGKGGVGKSTVTVNLAFALQQLGHKIGILDADIYGPSIPRMLGLKGRPESDGQRIQPLRRDGMPAMSMGMLTDEDTAMIWRGPMVANALQQLMNDVDWGELDVLMVDLPPGTGDAQLTLAQRAPLSGAVIVSTPQDIALIDARKGLNMFRRVEVPVLGIIENMSYFLCPDCGGRHHIFGHGGARETALDLGTDFLGEIPLQIAIREGSDEGRPIVVSAPESVEAQAFLDAARAVVSRLEDITSTPSA